MREVGGGKKGGLRDCLVGVVSLLMEFFADSEELICRT